MMTHCPFCERPFSKLEEMLGEHDPRFQCHHCWSRVQSSRKSKSAPVKFQKHQVRIVRPRHEKRAA